MSVLNTWKYLQVRMALCTGQGMRLDIHSKCIVYRLQNDPSLLVNFQPFL